LSPASAGFLIRLLFNTENGSDTILRNVPHLSTDYWLSITEGFL
jgi:hypothetical protein